MVAPLPLTLWLSMVVLILLCRLSQKGNLSFPGCSDRGICPQSKASLDKTCSVGPSHIATAPGTRALPAPSGRPLAAASVGATSALPRSLRLFAAGFAWSSWFNAWRAEVIKDQANGADWCHLGCKFSERGVQSAH